VHGNVLLLDSGIQPENLVILSWKDHNTLSRDQAWGALALMMMHRCPDYLSSRMEQTAGGSAPMFDRLP
jgi:hypothetical protein